jgi:glyoxylase-like metal-dependent hydrolase (beta-lactamase superfamily II)
MSALHIRIIDLDFPVGSKNKTATLITGDREAMLVDAGFTRADGHRLVAEVLDSGKALTTVFVSHADPDYYWGAEVLADAFPEAELIATPQVIEHIRERYEGKLTAWEPVGDNRPTRLVELAPLTGDILFEGHRFQLRGGHPAIPDRHYLWQSEERAIVGGVLVFSNEHVWTADTATPEQRAAWIAVLDEMEALEPLLVVPGHRLPDAPADVSAIRYTRDYLNAFEEILAPALDGAAVTDGLVGHYPDAGMLIAAQIGPKVAKGEMSWG